MKKLMIAAAALCGTVLTASAISSSNIVGYSNGALTNGASIATAQFKQVSGEGFTLYGIKPSSYGVSLYTVDMHGAPQKIYTWTDCGGEDWDTPDVWVDSDDNSIVSDFAFGAGSGLFISGTANSDTIQTAGEVGKEDVTVTLCNGANLVGNPFPVETKLNEVTVNTYGISLYKINEHGAPQKIYTWTDCGGPDWDTPDVWVDSDDNSIIDDSVVIKAGEGVFVSGTSATDTITFAAPELN